jgi:hypothetical protein
MRRALAVLAMGLGLTFVPAVAAQETPQADTGQSGEDRWHKAEQSAVLILVGDGGGRVESVSAGVVTRGDGIVLTAYQPIKNAQEVQVRLRDGEVYDQVDLIDFDERRNVAALHVPAVGLPALPVGALGEVSPGEKVHVLSNIGGLTWTISDGVFGAVRLADEVSGAGQGFRVIQFVAPIPAEAAGGALLNSQGQLLGLLTVAAGSSAGPQFAVPIESVLGLAAQFKRTALGSGKNLSLPKVFPKAAGALAEEANPIATLAKARALRVTSRTTYFTPFMLERELLNNLDFRRLGMNVVRSNRGGDLTVEIDRPLFTYDFTYSVMDSRTSTVLATGKVTAIDGPHAAGGIAKKLVQEFERARTLQVVPANKP